MNLRHILTIVWSDMLILRHVKWRLIEMSLFPITTLILWGLFAVYSRQYAAEAGMLVLVGNLLWSFAHLAQQEANMLMMEDLWTFNLRHILVAGVSEVEYMLGKLCSSTAIAVSVGAVMGVIAHAFGAPLAEYGMTTLLLAVITLLGSLAMAVMIAGTVIVAGREYAFLSWSTLHFLVFFSAPFFSPSLLPAGIRWITVFMPFTRVFEIGRAMVAHAPVTGTMLGSAFLVVLVYVVLAWPYYLWAYRHARKTGMLARITT